MLDYVITRQRHVRDVHITRVMRGTSQWSDHLLVRSLVTLELHPPRRHRAVKRRKLEVSKLHDEETRLKLQESIRDRLQHSDQQATDTNAEDQWLKIKEATYMAASELLGFSAPKHKDWFDEQDVEAQVLLDNMHFTHLALIKDKNSTAKKSAYTRARQKAQYRLREMKNRWWTGKAEELQQLPTATIRRLSTRV